jgi:hypothetical protein
MFPLVGIRPVVHKRMLWASLLVMVAERLLPPSDPASSLDGGSPAPPPPAALPPPSPRWFSPGSLHIGLKSGGWIQHSGRRREASRARVGGANVGQRRRRRPWKNPACGGEPDPVRPSYTPHRGVLPEPDPCSRRRLPLPCGLVAATRAPPDEREYARRVGTEPTQVNGDSGHGGLLRAADPAGPSYASPTAVLLSELDPRSRQ